MNEDVLYVLHDTFTSDAISCKAMKRWQTPCPLTIVQITMQIKRFVGPKAVWRNLAMLLIATKFFKCLPIRAASQQPIDVDYYLFFTTLASSIAFVIIMLQLLSMTAITNKEIQENNEAFETVTC